MDVWASVVRVWRVEAGRVGDASSGSQPGGTVQSCAEASGLSGRELVWLAVCVRESVCVCVFVQVWSRPSLDLRNNLATTSVFMANQDNQDN